MTVIDSLAFARAGQSLSGNLPVREMARLRDSLFDTEGEVRYQVQGGQDARQRPVLMLEISGRLHLQCQRCLGTLDYPLRIANTLLLTGTGETDSVEDEDAESVEASPELDVAGLVEDEIILGLPYSPRHNEGACQQGMSVAAQGAGSSAFARLASLKRNSH